ncbi:MAG TPA: 16S rRNA (guanine(527)-N(7))-methyltransferase RsmG [Xanthobacteraceae bacterium]|jgi:16S rRNA (guanine527-N7)-methyltransferase
MSVQDLSSDRARALALTPVSRETEARLDRFVALLLQWQNITHLIAPSTVPILWTRHIADSLQLIELVPAAKIWVDMGTGGGFPGLVIACALYGMAGRQVHLIESNGKKAAFLREAVAGTDAPAVVHGERMEKFVETFRQRADSVTARAVSPLSSLLGQCLPLLKEGTTGLFPKGQDVEAELTEASKCWKMTADLVPSRTDPKAGIVRVRALEPRRSVRKS